MMMRFGYMCERLRVMPRGALRLLPRACDVWHLVTTVSLVAGHWSLVTGRWSLVRRAAAGRDDWALG